MKGIWVGRFLSVSSAKNNSYLYLFVFVLYLILSRLAPTPTTWPRWCSPRLTRSRATSRPPTPWCWTTRWGNKYTRSSQTSSSCQKSLTFTWPSPNPYLLGCCLDRKSVLIFKDIEPWPWVTVRSLKILVIIYIGIDKRSPLGTQFGGKTTY